MEIPGSIKLTKSAYKRPEYPEWAFRPGYPVTPITINYMFINGGMGDYICWSQAIRWMATKCTWITGRVIVSDYMVEPMKYWLAKINPAWQAWDMPTLKAREDEGMPFRGPLNMANESMNATGAHLLDCGWVYFTNQMPPPEGWDHYPPFEQPDLDKLLLKFTDKLPKHYAVITTGKTQASRMVPDDGWNHIIDYCVLKGVTPVFLGQSTTVTGCKANIETKFGESVKYSSGVDLRNQTTLMEAAAVMSKAQFVLGHDNGLLHLAGCTTAPIIFGYNVAAPKHRRPRRPVGKVYDITLTHKELACIHCQSNTNFLIGYNFNQCWYGDLLCIPMLFENGAARWKAAIDQCLADHAAL